MDKASHRHKFDNKLREDSPDLNITRVRADIQDLVLQNVPAIKNHVSLNSKCIKVNTKAFIYTPSQGQYPKFIILQEVIAISKHLCGAATDFALNALANFSSVADSPKSNDNHKNKLEGHSSNIKDKQIGDNEIREENQCETKKIVGNAEVSSASTCDYNLMGIMIALCCHHRCRWRSFVGKKYLLKNAGFLPKDFAILCSLTSWAVCGSGKPREKGRLNKYFGYNYSTWHPGLPLLPTLNILMS